MIVYIAGPMRGRQYFNFPAFDAVKAELSAKGFTVVSPADMDRKIGFDPELLGSDYDWTDLNQCHFSLMDAIDRDVDALKKCEAIYMLNGWEQSKGAKAEKALAEWIGLKVMYQSAPDVLKEALEVTQGDRQAQYGPPDQDFRRTAGMWTALFGDLLKDGASFEPFHVAQAMILLKMSRQMHQRKRDNWVDAAGYARCGAMCDEAK